MHENSLDHERLEALAAAAGITGISVAVVGAERPPSLWALGVRNARSGEPVDNDTLFEAASISKPVFAYAVLRMAERGELSLDTPLIDYLRLERLGHDPRCARITARMVLSHTTGLPNWGAAELVCEHDPGFRFGYSGEGFVCLQKVVEHLADLTLEELVRREVLEPLGMNATTYVWRDELAARLADGHDSYGRPLPKARVVGQVNDAAGGLLTTAADYGKLLTAILTGKGLSAPSWRAMLSPQVQVVELAASRQVDAVFWGLGWGLQHGPAGNAFFHWGDNPGYKCYALGYPQTGCAIVYLSNCDHGLSIAEPLMEAFAADRHEALAWLGYERHDAAQRLIRRGIVVAFRDDPETGHERYAELRREFPQLYFEPLIIQAGLELLHEESVASAIAVFQLAAGEFPDASDAHAGLAACYLTAGLAAAAIAGYERTLELAPGHAAATAALRWIREGIAARERLRAVAAAELERCVGRYGPIRVWLQEGELLGSIEGRPGGYRLVPLGDDTFEPNGLGAIRIRFVPGAGGLATMAIVRHASGRRDDVFPRIPS